MVRGLSGVDQLGPRDDERDPTPWESYTQIFFFRNLVKSTRNQIAFTIFRLICIQTDIVRLDPNQSENGKCNLISG